MSVVIRHLKEDFPTVGARFYILIVGYIRLFRCKTSLFITAFHQVFIKLAQIILDRARIFKEKFTMLIDPLLFVILVN